MLAIGIGGNTLPSYDITDSLRFRSSASAYLERTPTTAGNQKTWTLSTWVKLGIIPSNVTLMEAGTGGLTRTNIGFNPDSKFVIYSVGAGAEFQLGTNGVFRDTSAWYHIVLAVDTTQSTANDRVKIYINGELQSNVVLYGASAPTQNADLFVNSTNTHRIASVSYASSTHFDGYMTEWNFVDGQALDPSDFGEYNSVTGVWQPKEYTGTYGTNGFYLNFADKTDFKSFELDGTGDYISAPASEYSNYINGSGDFTIEWWVNYDALPASGFGAGWYAQDSGAAVVSPFNLVQGGNTWYLWATTANGAWNIYNQSTLATTSLTTNRWYHIACVRNSGTLTLYVDGVAAGNDGGTIGSSSIWQDTSHNLSLFSRWQSQGSVGGIDGTISNYRLVKGTAVYTSNFTPPTANLENISGTTILLARSTSTADLSGNITTTANGNLSLVDHLPPISSAIGDDVSGNDNHFATNNFDLTSTATTYDLMSDTPTLTDEDTSNFPTLNINLRNFTYLGLINGALHTVAGGANVWQTIAATMAVPTSGKYYWESTFEVLSGTNPYGMVGLLPTYYSDVGSNSYTGSAVLPNGFSFYFYNGVIFNNNTSYSYGNGGTTGDVFGVAVDADNGKIWFSKNGVWQNSGDPVAGTNDATSVTGQTYDTTQEYYPTVSVYNTSQVSINFGQQPFKYTPPTGYKKLNTYNLPDSTITNGSQYMNTVLYTGTGASQSITTGFSPDLVWLKSRSYADHNIVYDTVRGAGQRLYTSLTNAEGTSTNQFTSFDSDGFTLGSDPGLQVNKSGETFVSWSWRGSDSTAVSNTDGSVTSTVSANTTSGFSIVSYTCPASGTYTVGHGLGTAPAVVIVKDRGANNTAWFTYHKDVITSVNNYLSLQATSAIQTVNGVFGSTLPNNTVFSSSADIGVVAGNAAIAYCFAEVEGFSKFGSYESNYNAAGPFVYTGFRPAFVLFKNADSAQGWYLQDTARQTYNVMNQFLRPNTADAEGTAANSICDFLSNGFKIRGTGADVNGTAAGQTIVYMAFAENPFKNSLAR